MKCCRCGFAFTFTNRVEVEAGAPHHARGVPVEGSVVICTECGFLNIAEAGGLACRAPSYEEAIELAALREVINASAAIAAQRAARRGGRRG